VSVRELIVLGTASQSPTKARNHNGYLLRWDTEAILFDPGEGTQRQFAFAGVSPAIVTQICITHFHGDHCLGLPGMLLRLSLDQVTHPVHLYYPASGEPHLHHLRHASIGHDTVDLHTHPVETPGVVHHSDEYTLRCAALHHRVPALGWRIEEPDGRRMLPDRLAGYGIEGPEIGAMRDAGSLDTAEHGLVTLDQVSEPRRGQSFAFVMDTAWCDGALELAEGVDLLVCESTFLEAEADLAAATGHMTARQAGRLAAEAGARSLVLTHFSQRYGDEPEAEQRFLDEARSEFAEVVVAHDFDRIAVPARH
jgi:ribonuclease Z